MTGGLFVAVHLMRHWPSPWGVIGLPLGLFFFLAGALYRRHVARLGWPLTVAALATAALAFVSAPLDVKVADYGTPILSIVAALGLCHLVFVFAQRLPPSRIVAALGQASLVVMYLHLTILYALRDRLPEGSRRRARRRGAARRLGAAATRRCDADAATRRADRDRRTLKSAAEASGTTSAASAVRYRAGAAGVRTHRG